MTTFTGGPDPDVELDDREGRAGLINRGGDDDEYGDSPETATPSRFTRFLTKNVKGLAIALGVVVLLLVVFVTLQATGWLNPALRDSGTKSSVEELDFPSRAGVRRKKGEQPVPSPVALELLECRNAFVAVVAAMLATKGPVLEVPYLDDTTFVMSDLLETLTGIERRQLTTMFGKDQGRAMQQHRAQFLPSPNNTNVVPLNPLHTFQIVANPRKPFVDYPKQPWGVLFVDFSAHASALAAVAKGAAPSSSGRASSFLPLLYPSLLQDADKLSPIPWADLISKALPVDIVVAQALPSVFTPHVNQFNYRMAVQWFDAPPAYLLSQTIDVAALFRLGSGPLLGAQMPSTATADANTTTTAATVETKAQAAGMSARSFPGAEANSHVLPLITSALATTGAILEMGTSEYGTPLLNLLSRMQDRYVLTADSDIDAVQRFEGGWSANNHEYTIVGDGMLAPPPPRPEGEITTITSEPPLVPTLPKANASDEAAANSDREPPLTWSQVGGLEKWDVAYVASTPTYERLVHARRLAKTTELVVVSGAEDDTNDLANAVSNDDTFKYSFLYDTFVEPTAVFSNSYDVTTLFESIAAAANATLSGSVAHRPVAAHCKSNPCQHMGDCIEYFDSFGCTCAPGWEGTVCDRQSDLCKIAFEPCAGHGECQAVSGTEYKCKCADGWTGSFCDFPTDECASEPCQNGGTCTDLHNSFACTCAPGFLGKLCEREIPKTARNGLVAILGALSHQLLTRVAAATTTTAADKKGTATAAVAIETFGSVLELGVERYSTELLHVMCQAQLNRDCTSIDTATRIAALPPSVTTRRTAEDPTTFVDHILAESRSRDDLLEMLKSRKRWSVVIVDYSDAGPAAGTADLTPAEPYKQELLRSVLDLPAIMEQCDVAVVVALPPEYTAYANDLNSHASIKWFEGLGEHTAWVLSNTTDVSTLFSTKTLDTSKPPESVKKPVNTPSETEETGPEHTADLVPLAAAVLATEGSILQLGVNAYSLGVVSVLSLYGASGTPAVERFVVSASSDPRFVKRYEWLARPGWHELLQVPVYKNLTTDEPVPYGPSVMEAPDEWESVGLGVSQPWSVVVIDHQPAVRRKVDIERFCCDGTAQLLLWHDASNAAYGYETMLPRFANAIVYDGFATSTTAIASNIVKNLLQIFSDEP